MRAAVDSSHRVVSAVAAYIIAVTLIAKVARVVVLVARTGSAGGWAYLPASLGQDLVLLALLVLCAIFAARLQRPAIGWAALSLPVLLTALLLPADVVAHKLTGAPITWQRLRGDEGATLQDLDLLAKVDLYGGLAGLFISLLLIWPALRWAHRARPLRWFSNPRNAALLLVAGLVLSFAQDRLLRGARGLADQPVFVLLASFGGEVEVQAQGINAIEWARLHTPAMPPPAPYKAPKLHDGDRPRNVIVFLAEGIPFKHTSFGGRHASKATPNLKKWSQRHGLVFSRYYANWHASNQAIFSVVCSSFPPIGTGIGKLKPRIDCGEFSEVLSDRGLRMGLFHGGRFSFYNKLALLGRRGYEIQLDAEDLGRGKKYKANRWGIDDRAMAEAMLQWLDTLPADQPFGALMVPITAHYPYWVPKGFKDKGSRTRRKRFLNAVAFQDKVFDSVIRGLQKRGRYKDTLLVWLGDHGHSVQEPSRETAGVRGFYQTNLHTPLVLINERLFGPGKASKRSDRVGSHPDLLPTILDALGHGPDPRHDGQSLVSNAYRPRRAFFGAMGGRYVGFVEHDSKFVLNLKSRRTEYYDLAADPDEENNLSDEAPERMDRYTGDVLRFAGAVKAKLAAAPVLKEKVSIRDLYRLVRTHAKLQVVTGLETRLCDGVEGGRQRTCPGVGPMFSVKRKRIQDAKRHCLMVALPDDASLEMRITDPVTLQLMTATVVALPGKGETQDVLRVTATSDGRAGRKVKLGHKRARRIEYPQARKELVIRFSPGKEPGADKVCLELSKVRR